MSYLMLFHQGTMPLCARQHMRYFSACKMQLCTRQLVNERSPTIGPVKHRFLESKTRFHRKIHGPPEPPTLKYCRILQERLCLFCRWDFLELFSVAWAPQVLVWLASLVQVAFQEKCKWDKSAMGICGIPAGWARKATTLFGWSSPMYPGSTILCCVFHWFLIGLHFPLQQGERHPEQKQRGFSHQKVSSQFHRKAHSSVYPRNFGLFLWLPCDCHPQWWGCCPFYTVCKHII